MINVDKALPTGAELVMQVHDSLIVECNEAIAKDVVKILQQQMESVAPELKIKHILKNNRCNVVWYR